MVRQGLSMLQGLLVLCALTGIQGVDVGSWTSFLHGIRGTVSFPNPTTVQLDNFFYDGGGLTVFLYYYPPGARARGSGGTIIPVSSASEGQFTKGYTGQTVLGKLASGTVCDIGTLTVWCRPFDAVFSEVVIDHSRLFINSGRGSCRLVGGNTDLPELLVEVYDNCVPFSNLRVSWTVDRVNSEMDFEMCSCRAIDSVLNQYMGFGLSGSNGTTAMIGADVTIAWLDNNLGVPNAIDYYLTARVQCREGKGACPDTMVAGANPACTNDVVASSIRGGIRESVQQCVAFSRPLSTSDSVCDQDFNVSNQEQYIVWAIGGLGETAFIHFERADPTSPPIHLGRDRLNQCSTPISCAGCPPFPANQMKIPESTTLRVYIGPSAKERGYMGITVEQLVGQMMLRATLVLQSKSQAGWGISWYVNDVLIPELVVQRGSSYTFIIEGGNDIENAAIYHPFYITDSINGGRIANTAEQRASETVYAGFDANDEPIGVGRLCERAESAAASNIRDTCGSMEQYIAEIRKEEPVCADGEPGTFTWTPDDNTPDVVYYQCATHQNLGWRIVVNGDVATTSVISLSCILLRVISAYLFM